MESITKSSPRAVITRDRAAVIAGIKPARVDYWVRTGVIEAMTSERVAGRVRMQLNYTEMLALMVAARLRENNVSLQHIRKIVERLKARGYDSPLTSLNYAIHRGELYFRDESGTWEGTKRPDQVVIHQAIELAPLRAQIERAAQRDARLVGHVEQRRGRLGSKPVLAGTRIPVATIERYLSAGKSDHEILEAFPTLQQADLNAVRKSA